MYRGEKTLQEKVKNVVNITDGSKKLRNLNDLFQNERVELSCRKYGET